MTQLLKRQAKAEADRFEPETVSLHQPMQHLQNRLAKRPQSPQRSQPTGPRERTLQTGVSSSRSRKTRGRAYEYKNGINGDTRRHNRPLRRKCKLYSSGLIQSFECCHLKTRQMKGRNEPQRKELVFSRRRHVNSTPSRYPGTVRCRNE